MTTGERAFAHRYGPWAVVTGASDGIGRAFAEALADAGLDLVLVARRRPELEALAARLQQARGVRCRVLDLDFTAPDASEHLANATADLDVGLLVAAAGYGTSGALLDAALASELGMVDVNCRTVTAQAWHFGGRMAARGRGGMVFLSSIVAFQGTPHAAHYAATKAYVQVLAEGLRHEWAPLGVDVVVSAPGPTRTGFARRADMRMSTALEPGIVARGTLHALGRQTTVRPGWLSKLLGWSLASLPRWGATRIIAKVMAGMTEHQRKGPAQAEL